MIVGCYSVDLYCDNDDPTSAGKKKPCPAPFQSSPPQYSGETEGECLRQARADGWVFTRKRPRFAYCPWCSGKKGRLPPPV